VQGECRIRLSQLKWVDPIKDGLPSREQKKHLAFRPREKGKARKAENTSEKCNRSKEDRNVLPREVALTCHASKEGKIARMKVGIHGTLGEVKFRPKKKG